MLLLTLKDMPDIYTDIEQFYVSTCLEFDALCVNMCDSRNTTRDKKVRIILCNAKPLFSGTNEMF